MTTTSTTTSTTKVITTKVGFVKRFKVVCPTCGKQVWNDATEYHKKAEHPWD